MHLIEFTVIANSDYIGMKQSPPPKIEIATRFALAMTLKATELSLYYLLTGGI